MIKNLKDKTTQEILEWFEICRINQDEIIEIELLELDIQEIGYKAIIDLAQLFFLKMMTPISKDSSVILKFLKLDRNTSFHKTENSNEKYGVNSEFFLIDKTKQFSFLYHYQKALNFIDIENKNTILNLGVNKGDEFKVIQNILSKDEFESKEFIGVDYSATVVEFANKDFNKKNVKFICHDINHLDKLILPKFDLIISIGTLQSSNINFNTTFMNIYQNYLKKGGAIILGFPNCRWIDGEMVYGAKAPNYSFSEMSFVLKDIHFCKKYLQQKKYRVTITGNDYLFLSARKIN